MLLMLSNVFLVNDTQLLFDPCVYEQLENIGVVRLEGPCLNAEIGYSGYNENLVGGRISLFRSVHQGCRDAH